MRLSDLQKGQSARIVRVHGAGAFRKRILEMGFVQGQEVTMLGRAPLGDPYRFEVMGYCVTLRREELLLIDVEPIAPQAKAQQTPTTDATPLTHDSTTETDLQPRQPRPEGKGGKPSKTIRVALVGNPNSGKTSLFNFAAGAKEHTGNYSGVTIESKTAHFTHGDYTIAITDLPGTYSLTAYSPEERYVRNFIDREKPDVVINVIDTTNLERSLYLTLLLREMGARVAIALNMYDEFQEQGGRINRPVLTDMLGVVSTPTVGRTGRGIDALLDSVVALYKRSNTPPVDVIGNYGEAIAKATGSIGAALETLAKREGWTQQTTRYYALKILERDAEVTELIESQLQNESSKITISAAITSFEKSAGKDSETYLTDTRYAFIAKVMQRAYTKGRISKQKRLQDRIDRVLMHRWLGLPIFLFLMYLMFWITFTVGEYPKGWIEGGVEWLGELLNEAMPAGPLLDMLQGAVIGGVGNVIVFLPHIMILFLCISLLEDSGYMARAVFVIDRVMRGVGLHGHSFIPLVMGFGCNVPAIMATRAIADRKVRLVTILVNPFMSCSARLPVYVLFISAIFPKQPGLVLFGIYTFGVALALLTALLFRKTLFRGAETPFVMEMPPYRMPTLRATLRHMWSKAVQYLHKMGTVILVASIIIWFFSYFPASTPRDEEFAARSEQSEQRLAALATTTTTAPDSAAIAETEVLKDSLQRELSQIANERTALQQRNSLLGRLGQAVEPAIEPLGFDWRIGVGLLSGFAAKEVVVSTLGALMQMGGDQDEESVMLRERVRTVRVEAGPRKGELLFTPIVVLALMAFVLLYVPCIAAIAAIKKESGSWRWALFSVVYSTALAYIFALVIYQVGSLF